MHEMDAFEFKGENGSYCGHGLWSFIKVVAANINFDGYKDIGMMTTIIKVLIYKIILLRISALIIKKPDYRFEYGLVGKRIILKSVQG